jgi:rhodanese-related sulfurtransferase
MMRRTLILVLLAVMGLSLVAFAAPKIASDTLSYNFGTVLEGTVVTHTFVLTNSGNSALSITGVHTSCGCTTAALTKSTLAPGESVGLTVHFNTAHYQGQVQKTVYVQSNDPSTPQMTLTLAGTVTKLQSYQIAAGDLNDLFYLLVDLRSPDQYAASHLMGAINIPDAQLSSWLDRLPKESLIILYDQDGSLSDKAAQMMNSKGFPAAKSLAGGLKGWMIAYGNKYIIASEKASS